MYHIIVGKLSAAPWLQIAPYPLGRYTIHTHHDFRWGFTLVWNPVRGV